MFDPRKNRDCPSKIWDPKRSVTITWNNTPPPPSGASCGVTSAHNHTTPMAIGPSFHDACMPAPEVMAANSAPFRHGDLQDLYPQPFRERGSPVPIILWRTRCLVATPQMRGLPVTILYIHLTTDLAPLIFLSYSLQEARRFSWLHSGEQQTRCHFLPGCILTSNLTPHTLHGRNRQNPRRVISPSSPPSSYAGARGTHASPSSCGAWCRSTGRKTPPTT